MLNLWDIQVDEVQFRVRSHHPRRDPRQTEINISQSHELRVRVSRSPHTSLHTCHGSRSITAQPMVPSRSTSEGRKETPLVPWIRSLSLACNAGIPPDPDVHRCSRLVSCQEAVRSRARTIRHIKPAITRPRCSTPLMTSSAPLLDDRHAHAHALPSRSHECQRRRLPPLCLQLLLRTRPLQVLLSNGGTLYSHTGSGT